MAVNEKNHNDMLEISTFQIGKALCGIDILLVQEINKLTEITKVPQAPFYVEGILNLRGKIITLIDLGKKLGLQNANLGEDHRNIIVNASGGLVGLLVTKISNVVQVDPLEIESAPANISGIQGVFFSGVYKQERDLIGILNVNEVLKLNNDSNNAKLV